MKINIKTALATATLALPLFATSAHALPLNVPAGGSALLPFGAVVGTGSFTESYSFNISGIGSLTGIAGSLFVKGFGVSLTGLGGNYSNTFSDSSGHPGFQFSVAGLAPGNYDLTFKGQGNSHFSAYGGVAKVTAAVPEPATIVMALVAAGLLGGLGLRARSR